VSFVAGKNGNAADLISSDLEALTVADNDSLSMGDIDFFIGGWLNPDNMEVTRTILNKSKDNGLAGTDKEYLLSITSTDGDVTFGVSDDTTYNSVTLSTALSIDTWAFVLAYHDAANDLLGISVDGSSFTTAAHSAGSFNSNGRLDFGRQGVQDHFDGSLDGWFIYKNRIPTSLEVIWLYNGGNGRTYSNLS
jgi:hypothetical protein